MWSNYKLIITIAIVSVLIVGGAYTYNQSKGKPTSKPETKVKTEQSTAQTKTTAKLPELPASPSGEESQQFMAALQSQAQTSTTLEIAKCQPQPEILKVKQGTSFTIKNSGTEEHTILISSKHIYTVSAGKSVAVAGNIEAAVYTYSCKSGATVTNSKAGTLFVEK